MDKITEKFLATAAGGDSVFISDVRRGYLNLAEDESFACALEWEKFDGGRRTFFLRLPRFLGYTEEAGAFVRDYFLAQVHNILCVLGGRSAVLACPGGAAEAGELIAEFTRRFRPDLAMEAREGYGRRLNVVDRMARALSPGGGDETGFVLSLGGAGDAAPPPPPAGRHARAANVLRRAARRLDGRALLGIDIGGTDIKLALAVDGRLTALGEHDWNPALFTRAEEFIQPVLELIGEMAGKLDGGRRFDAIGVSFPDVVVADRIVGGETPKTLGMRKALGAGYDREFAGITALPERLAPFLAGGGRVGIVNDGAMAAFAAGVEMAALDPSRVEDGVFAHALGTDLGSGWVDEAGRVPDLPLEVYCIIVDLGSRPERRFPADDVRGIVSYGGGLPGCPQRYASQSGVFRLAVKHFSKFRPDLLKKIRSEGFLTDRGADGREGLFVPAAPRDMRKPFLEYLMRLMEREADPNVHRVFEDVGAALAAVGEEIDWALSPAARRRYLFGRLVKNDFCFRLIEKGAAAAGSRLEYAVADEGLAVTPLMRELGGRSGFPVAQFAQAVGAAHYANHRLEDEA